jgi:hypothetical protein
MVGNILKYLNRSKYPQKVKKSQENKCSYGIGCNQCCGSADQDLAFPVDADPDQTIHSDADPGTFHFDANLHHWPTGLHSSIVSLHSYRVRPWQYGKASR